MNRYLLTALISLLTLLNYTSYAQPADEGTVAVTIYDSTGKPATYATVYLHKLQDSSLVKATIVDQNGNVQFSSLSIGGYFIRVTGVNYAPFESTPFELSAFSFHYTLPPVYLQVNRSSTLQGVTVTARKPLLQKLNDRLVVNVEGSIVNAGSSLMEIMDRLPGVKVDANDNISMNGKSNVLVLIDGKPTSLTGSELNNYLRSFSSSSIDRIELISNPSSRYDASGTAGLIDIRLKKDQKLGTNGTMTTGFGYGQYPKANAALSLNNRNRKVNVFGNYTYNYQKSNTDLYQRKEFFSQRLYDGGFEIFNKNYFPQESQAFRLGADFTPGKRSIIGVMFSGNYSNNDRLTDNTTYETDVQRVPVSMLLVHSNTKQKTTNYLFNLNYKLQLPKAGQELNLDADYSQFKNNPASRLATSFYKMDGTVLQPDFILQSKLKASIDLLTFKADYSINLKSVGKLEAGLKSSFIDTDNNASFHDASSGTPVFDPTRSNHFLYSESNYAGYTNLAYKFKKVNGHAGLRLERTQLEGNQLATEETFKNDYTKLFPSLLMNWSLPGKQTLSFGVNKRIDRPNYVQLNPFRFFLDYTTYNIGNPYLRPRLIWSYEAAYSLRQYSVTLAYSRTKDYYTTFVVPADNNERASFQRPTHLKLFTQTSATFIAPFKVTRWWESNNHVFLYYKTYKGFIANTPLDKGVLQMDATLNNVFFLGSGWTAELGGTYLSAGRIAFMTSVPTGYINAGLQKTIMNNKASLRFNVRDIFWMNVRKGLHSFVSFDEHWISRRESRIANLTFSYKFGKNTVAAARRRNLASEEERRRAGE